MFDIAKAQKRIEDLEALLVESGVIQRSMYGSILITDVNVKRTRAKLSSLMNSLGYEEKFVESHYKLVKKKRARKAK